MHFIGLTGDYWEVDIIHFASRGLSSTRVTILICVRVSYVEFYISINKLMGARGPSHLIHTTQLSTKYIQKKALGCVGFFFLHEQDHDKWLRLGGYQEWREMTHWMKWSDTLDRETHGNSQPKTVNFNFRLQLISGNLHIFQSLSCNDFNFVNFKADAVVISITNNNKWFWYLYFTLDCNADQQNGNHLKTKTI